MNGSVLLCGLGMVGWRVLDFLRNAGGAITVIDEHIDPADPRLTGVRFVKGDCRDKAVLIEAGVNQARGVIIVTSDDLVNITAAMMVRSINADVRIVLRMFNQNLIERLGKAVRHVTAFSVSALSAPLLALTALTGDVLAAFPVGQEHRQVANFTVAAGSKLAGLRIAELEEQGRFVVLAHTPVSNPARLLKEVDREALLQPDDRLAVCGDPEDVRRLLEPGGDSLDVLWAGKLRRYGRLLWRTLSEVDLGVKICTLALVGTIAFSMCVCHFGLGHPWADSLYRTISLIATGSDMDGQNYEAWGKVFVSFLRIMGTAIVAAFTAIVTRYLLAARLGGAFEARRIPDRGHVVVCGLGNVGYRVVEELIALKERVVVVDRRADNPFIASCRRQGAAVVVGDATLTERLKRARVDSARAVIVVTSSDLVNLEIALLIAEIKPGQRVVVRIGDSIFAETVRQAASVKLAVSVSELSAPAFVAGLLGDRVRAVFLAGGRMLAVLEITVAENDTGFVGMTPSQLVDAYPLIPLALIDAEEKAQTFGREDVLKAGDRLSIVATLADLERIVRREAV